MADSIEIEVTCWLGEPCASFDWLRKHCGSVAVYVHDGEVYVEADDASAMYIPVDTLRAAIAAHDAAALWSYSDEHNWERADASGCQWQIRHEYRAVLKDFVFAVFRNDGDGFVQIGEPHATWGMAMFAVEGMLAK